MGICLNDCLGKPRKYYFSTDVSGDNVLENIRLFQWYAITDSQPTPFEDKPIVYVYDATAVPGTTPGYPDLQTVFGLGAFVGDVQPGFNSFEPGGIHLDNVSYLMQGSPSAGFRGIWFVYLDE